jgi:hypothetical protein
MLFWASRFFRLIVTRDRIPSAATPPGSTHGNGAALERLHSELLAGVKPVAGPPATMNCGTDCERGNCKQNATRAMVAVLALGREISSPALPP